MTSLKGHSVQIDPVEAIVSNMTDYLCGSGSIRESLQNADDAGATSFKIVLDYTTLKTSLSGFSNFQHLTVPALCFSNDATFTKDDLNHFGKLMKSRKKKDFTCIGNHGKGSSSLYHFSDFTLLRSESNFIIFDPTKIVFKTGGVRSLESDKDHHKVKEEELTALKKLFNNTAMHVCFGKDNCGDNFKGTFFRYPLRKKRNEKFQSNPFKIGELKDVVMKFKDEVQSILLYLKSVKKVEAYVVNENSEVDQLYSVGIEGDLSKRNDLQKILENIKKFDILRNKEYKYPSQSKDDSNYELEIVVKEKNVGVKREKYMIFSRFGGDIISSKSLDLVRCGLKYFPYASISIKLNGSQENGLYYCFFPIGVKTDLPMNINSFFSISSDRRSFKTDVSNDTSSCSKDEIDWNKLLFSKKIPQIYKDIVLFFLKHKKEKLYEYFPCQRVTNASKTVCEGLFHILEDIPYVRTIVGDYSRPKDVLECDTSRYKSVLKVLLKLGIKVIDVPKEVLNEIKYFRKINSFKDFSVIGTNEMRSIIERNEERVREIISNDEKCAIELFKMLFIHDMNGKEVNISSLVEDYFV